MLINKVINNNVVSAKDTDGREVVLMGKGIGFQAKEGQQILEEKIEKLFKMDSQNSFDQFKKLLEALPLEHIQVSSEIIEYAKSVLGGRLNQNIYITLTDHINFTVERHKQGMLFENPLLWEVRKFYPSEYLIGEYSVALIEKTLGVKLLVDEAASIALHIVNAEYDMRMSETMNSTTIIKSLLEIIRDFVKADLDEESLHYSRLITHLKFLAQRVIAKESLDSDDPQFTEIVTNIYPDEYVCSKRIAKLIENKYAHQLTREEILYLTVHIKRVRKSTK